MKLHFVHQLNCYVSINIRFLKLKSKISCALEEVLSPSFEFEQQMREREKVTSKDLIEECNHISYCGI